MSSLNKIIIKKANLTVDEDIQFAGDKRDSQTDQLTAESISGNVITVDYYEDLLSPSITCYISISNTTNLLSRLPIRGYERLDLTIGTDFGDLVFSDREGKFNNPLYVTGISDVSRSEGQETFTLTLTSLENLMNETTRCQKKYAKANISAHVKDILTDPKIFNIKKEELEERTEIEDCITPYEFIGNNKKPFYILTWLCPKAQPLQTGSVGGTSGFFFYETYDGYKFKSVDGLISQTGDLESKKVQTSKSPIRVAETYTFSTFIEAEEKPENNFRIIHHYTDKTTNLQKNLRVGLYSNLTYFYNPLDWSTKAIPHKLKDELNKDGVKVAGKDVPIPAGDVSEAASRVLVRVGDKGMLAPTLETNQDDNVDGSGRSDSDMAKAFSRYTLLFQQSLNITVPCNINLRAGDIIKVQVPESGPNDNENKNLDQELSGFYLIRSLRHHFEISEGSNVTSLNLIRDSFGLT
ncbi:MAG: hypothetical protein CMA53_03790 [Euryarchaeota archaeon]|nr:hypothetical protein [Euryarchaeota archaeon]